MKCECCHETVDAGYGNSGSRWCSFCEEEMMADYIKNKLKRLKIKKKRALYLSFIYGVIRDKKQWLKNQYVRLKESISFFEREWR